ncbi:biopolymer transport protein ExbD [Archangium gephyra]|uniref:Biopolymer transport protein ExbD n=1 Tax=Archangium gephyra TaxID=48 RepID=A0AAC8Q7U9_9BACT|nr:biopolymer transporter ExbD [Archangium gephyra]AKJ02665.1 Biopolymer transport protein ExbD/TolR [Archangium gephyra]REG23210.1 biopolymer transport protein ExbD [Archangium gephyra]
MAMGKTPGDSEGNGEDVGFAEINITPLTDIFLVLLIIFMVTSSVIVQQAPGGAQTGLKVNLPKGGTTDVTARATDLSVAVLSDGRFVLGGNVVGEDELKRAFAKAQEENPDTVVIVQADEGVPHGTVVQVMEMAKSVGLGQLAIGVRDSR